MATKQAAALLGAGGGSAKHTMALMTAALFPSSLGLSYYALCDLGPWCQLPQLVAASGVQNIKWLKKRTGVVNDQQPRTPISKAARIVVLMLV